MGFRQRLVLFLVVTLVAVQVLTALAAYSFLRSTLVDRAKSELVAATGVFMRQLDVLSERATDDVQVLSLDYALRQAIAQKDYSTEMSALRNHGNRVGATRMMLVGLDGVISADTHAAGGAGRSFAYTKILADAADTGSRTALISADGVISWVVVAPVRAPETIAFIAAFIPVNNELLNKLRSISSVPRSIGLATMLDGRWTVVARNPDGPSQFPLPGSSVAPATQSSVITDNDREFLTESARLATAEGSDPAVAVLAYSLDEVLAQYRAVFVPILVVLALALIPALGAALLIARGVSRPLEFLAGQARHIADGDYSVPEPIKQKGELGHLSEALGTMTACIAQREAALNAAVASTEAARTEAVRANNAKSQFLANMSHELRTPLNAIVGFGEMLNQQVLGQLGNARYVEYARDICSSGQHLLGLVSRMLDLADLEKGSFVIGREDFSPAQLLRESVSGLRAMAETGRVNLKVADDGANWPVLNGDAHKVRQAITSLLHNAIKFTPEGGTVEISGTVKDSSLCLRITDTGVGMNAEDIDNVVKPFHRLRSAFDGNQQGAGLGLPFAKAVVESHGGSLHIFSKPGEGTSVEIRLPLLAKSLSEAA